MDYLELLENSYNIEKVIREEMNGYTPSKLEYLADNIFGFTTYDGDISEKMATKALEVCSAITNRTTLEYIKDLENYQWYISLLNMPFFSNRTDWGTSVRGAWWSAYGVDLLLHTCGIFNLQGEQLCPFELSSLGEFENFIEAVITFGGTK